MEGGGSNPPVPTNIFLIMQEVIYTLVAQGVLTKEQGDEVIKALRKKQQEIDESILESLSECV